MKEFFLRLEFFSGKKGHVFYYKLYMAYVIYQISDSKDRQKQRKYGRLLKKVIRNCRRQNEIFFHSPKTRLQVSAYGPNSRILMDNGGSDWRTSSIGLHL